ncbi:hypothetical protein Mapa_009963 [Marchantia paleacea]|nr:hypothetical protein Mapa_009963 [Marchantia paleacea]
MSVKRRMSQFSAPHASRSKKRCAPSADSFDPSCSKTRSSAEPFGDDMSRCDYRKRNRSVGPAPHWSVESALTSPPCGKTTLSTRTHKEAKSIVNGLRNPWNSCQTM